MSDENREPSSSEAEKDSSTEPAESPENDAAEAGAEPAKKAKGKAKGSKAKGAETVKDRNQRIREEAAARRSAKRDMERNRAAPARNLDASEIVDDALARGTHSAALWLKRHFHTLQWAAVVIVVGGIGYKIYDVRHERSVGQASDKLITAVSAERARVGEGSAEPDRYTGLADTRKHYASEEERLKAAAAAYAGAKESGGTLAALAKLGEAGILYDQSKFKEALAAYRDVRDSELASKDQDVKGRAIEGMGLSEEALGNHDAALKSYRELENSGITGFGPLGLYHQARLLHAKGDSAKAKELINKAIEKLNDKDKDKDRTPGTPPGYLQSAARELLAVIDPQAAALSSTGPTMDPQALQGLSQETGKGEQIDPQKLQELLKQLQQNKGQAPAGGEAPAGEAPAGEAPTPAAPASAP